MTPRPALLIPLFLILWSAAGISSADQASRSLQSHASIVDAVKQFLQSQTYENKISRRSVSVGYLDPRLKLPQCQQALETFFAPGAKSLGKTTVGVRCNDPKPWALYVSASVNGYANVYQTRHNIDKGVVLGEADIVPIEKNLAQLNYGYFIDKKALIGKATTRRLNRDQVIIPSQITDPVLIKRGEQVILIAKSSGFSVKMSGKAMMDGRKGQLIKVKNLSSKRVVEGRVIRSGEVSVLN